MSKLKNWTGLCMVLLSLQAYANEVSVQDVWMRMLTPAQETAMVGMVINSDKPARVVSVISPAYTSVAIQGPGKGGAKKTQELEFIELSAQKPVVLSADSVYLQLSGLKQGLGEAEKVTLIITVRFDDNTRKNVTVTAQTENGKKAAAQASSSNTAAHGAAVVAPAVSASTAESAAKAEAKAESVKAKPHAEPAKPVAAKRPVAEEKPVKVATPKPAPAPVAARVEVAAPPAPVAVPVPVVVAQPAVEPKKAPEVKPAEQPKQEDPRTSAECINLAKELRECDKANDMMIEWCVSNAKSKSSCPLSLDQVKKLKN